MDLIKKDVFKKYQTVFYREYNNLEDDPNNAPPESIFYSNRYYDGEFWKQQKFSITEDDFVKNYGNPACSVFCEVYTIVLEKNEDKISLKFFVNAKSRANGITYFRKGTKLLYLTYNFKSGDIYSGIITNYHKKRGKNKTSVVRKNAFFKSPVRDFFIKFKNLINGRDFNTGTLVSDYLMHLFLHFNIESEVDTVDQILFKRNMQKKGFKLPNNYAAFTHFYPIFSKKESKKFKGKFVDVVMNREGLSGGRFKKILHSVDKYTKSYSSLRNMFGEDFLNSLPDEYVKKIFEFDNECYNHTSTSFKNHKLLKSKKFIEIFKLVIDNKLNLLTLIDHIIFYDKLNRYELTQWEAYDYNSFSEEHMKFTERIEYYSNGVYVRFYDKNFIDHIQQKIIVNNVEYNPVVLFDSKTYAEESNYQSNCVRTYIKKPQSFIISLRKGLDRSTLEYQISRTAKGKVKMVRVQSRARFNQGIDESWNTVLEQLDSRIEKYLSNVGFTPPKMTVSFKNGKTLSAIMMFENVLTGEESKPYWNTETDPRQPLVDMRKSFEEVLNNDYRLGLNMPIPVNNINTINDVPF